AEDVPARECELAVRRPGKRARRVGHEAGRRSWRGGPKLAFSVAKSPAGKEGQLASAGRERVGPVLRGDARADPGIVEPEVAGEQIVGNSALVWMVGVEQERHRAVASDQSARDAGRELAPRRGLGAGHAQRKNIGAYVPRGSAYDRSSLEAHGAGSGRSAIPCS